MSDITLDTTDLDELPESSFTQELLKTAGLSVATTVGTLAGFALIGLTVDQIQKLRTSRAAKKAADTTVPTPEA